MTADELAEEAMVTQSSLWHLPDQRSALRERVDAETREHHRLADVIEETKHR